MSPIAVANHGITFSKKFPMKTTIVKEQPSMRGPRGAFRPIEPVDSVKEFDDVRDRDLSKLQPAAIVPAISTLDFNKDTVWPDQNLPPGKRPEKLLEEAMNPGLGVGKLHKQGVTGKVSTLRLSTSRCIRTTRNLQAR